MVGKDDVLHEHGLLRRKSGEGGADAAHVLGPHVEVPQQAPLVRVVERPLVGKFVHLPDVVQQRPGEEQVGIHPFVVGRQHAADPRDGDRVLQQPADVVVVHRLPARRLAEAARHVRFRRVRKDGREEPRQVLVLHRRDVLLERLPERLDPLLRDREVLGEVLRPPFLPPDLVDLELDAALVRDGGAAHLDHVVPVEPLPDLLGAVPHPRLDLSRPVAQLQGQVRLPGVAGQQRLVRDEEQVADRLPLLEVLHETRLLHRYPAFYEE